MTAILKYIGRIGVRGKKTNGTDVIVLKRDDEDLK